MFTFDDGGAIGATLENGAFQLNNGLEVEIDSDSWDQGRFGFRNGRRKSSTALGIGISQTTREIH